MTSFEENVLMLLALLKCSKSLLLGPFKPKQTCKKDKETIQNFILFKE